MFSLRYHLHRQRLQLIEVLDCADEQKIFELLAAGSAQFDTNRAVSLVWLLILRLTVHREQCDDRDLLNKLLNYKDNKDRWLIPPEPKLAGMTALKYLRTYHVEHPYIAIFQEHKRRCSQLPVRNDFELARIAQARQGIHTKEVNALCAKNIEALYKHYIDKHKKPFAAKAIREISKALLQQLEGEEAKPEKWQFDWHKQSAVIAGLKRCQETNLTFDIGADFTMRLEEGLALAYYAAVDDDAAMFCNESATSADKTSRIGAIFEEIYISQTEVRGEPCCPEGLFNRIIGALISQHKLVHSSAERLKGREALRAANEFFASVLQKLFEKDPEKYWTVLRAQWLHNPHSDADEKVCLAYVQENKKSWEKQLAKHCNIADDVITNFVGAMIDDDMVDFPYAKHRSSTALLTLINSARFAKQADAVFELLQGNDPQAISIKLMDEFIADDELTQAFQGIVPNALNKPSPQLLRDCLADLLDNECLGRTPVGIVNKLCQAKSLTNEEIMHVQASLLVCTYKALLPQLCKSSPGQASWLKGLSRQQIIDTFAALVMHDEIDLSDINSTAKAIIHSAVLQGIFSGDSLQGIHFTSCSLVGVDFTRVSVSGVIFTDCDLRLAIFDDENVCEAVFVNCRLNFFHQQNISSWLGNIPWRFPKLDGLHGYCIESHIDRNIKSLQKQLSENKFLNNFFIQQNAPLIKLFFEKGVILKEHLHTLLRYNYYPLELFITWADAELVEMVVNYQHFDKSTLHLKCDGCENLVFKTLMLYYGDRLPEKSKKNLTAIIRCLLNSPRADKSLLTQKDPRGLTVLEHALLRPEVACEIISSRYVDAEILAQRSEYHFSLLGKYCDVVLDSWGVPEQSTSVSTVLTTRSIMPSATEVYSQIKNKKGEPLFIKAVKRGDERVIKAFLEHKDFCPAIFASRDADGFSALHRALAINNLAVVRMLGDRYRHLPVSLTEPLPSGESLLTLATMGSRPVYQYMIDRYQHSQGCHPQTAFYCLAFAIAQKRPGAIKNIFHWSLLDDDLRRYLSRLIDVRTQSQSLELRAALLSVDDLLSYPQLKLEQVLAAERILANYSHPLLTILRQIKHYPDATNARGIKKLLSREDAHSAFISELNVKLPKLTSWQLCELITAYAALQHQGKISANSAMAEILKAHAVLAQKRGLHGLDLRGVQTTAPTPCYFSAFRAEQYELPQFSTSDVTEGFLGELITHINQSDVIDEHTKAVFAASQALISEYSEQLKLPEFFRNLLKATIRCVSAVRAQVRSVCYSETTRDFESQLYVGLLREAVHGRRKLTLVDDKFIFSDLHGLGTHTEQHYAKNLLKSSIRKGTRQGMYCGGNIAAIMGGAMGAVAGTIAAPAAYAHDSITANRPVEKRESFLRSAFAGATSAAIVSATPGKVVGTPIGFFMGATSSAKALLTRRPKNEQQLRVIDELFAGLFDYCFVGGDTEIWPEGVALLCEKIIPQIIANYNNKKTVASSSSTTLTLLNCLKQTLLAEQKSSGAERCLGKRRAATMALFQIGCYLLRSADVNDNSAELQRFNNGKRMLDVIADVLTEHKSEYIWLQQYDMG